MCEQLRLEISKVHAERIEKVEKKVSVKLVNKDPSKRVRIITVVQFVNIEIVITRRLTRYKPSLSFMRFILSRKGWLRSN